MSNSDFSSRLQQFTSRLTVIRRMVQDLKSMISDVRRCCRIASKIISDCREAAQFISGHDHGQKLFELGVEALEVANRAIQDAFSQRILPFKKWRAQTLVRRLNLKNEECMRYSVANIMLDQLYAHAAVKQSMEVFTLVDDAVYDAHEDFFRLINKAFSLSFGDEMDLEAGEVHSDYVFQIEESGITNDNDRCWKMSRIAVLVLAALAGSHSSWFHDGKIQLGNQLVVGSDQAIPKEDMTSDGPNCKLYPWESSRVLLSKIEGVTLDRQRIAFQHLLQWTPLDASEYNSKARSALSIVAVSVEAIRSATDPPQFYVNELFFYAERALKTLAQGATNFFGIDLSPLPLFEFYPGDDPWQGFPDRSGLPEQREWAITDTLNSLYRCKAGNSNRIIFAEQILAYCSGMEVQISPQAELKLKLPRIWSHDQLWRQVMLKSSSYALVGAAQYVLDYFPGKHIVLFEKQTEEDRNEVPKPRDQMGELVDRTRSALTIEEIPISVTMGR